MKKRPAKSMEAAKPVPPKKIGAVHKFSARHHKAIGEHPGYTSLGGK